MRLREGDHQRLLAFYRLAYSRLCIIRLMFCAIHRSRLRARRPHLEWWRGLKVGGDASVSKCVWEGDNCTTGPVPILKTPGPGQDPALVKLSYCLDIFIKALEHQKHHRFCQMIGLRNSFEAFDDI